MKTAAKALITILAVALSANTYSQIKVLSNGNVGVNQASPAYKLDVNGTTRLNGYVGINGPAPAGYPLAITSYYGQVISINPGADSETTAIGSSTDVIHFWYSSTTGHHKIYAQSYSTTSDSTLKKNIESLNPGALQKVLNLRPVSFEFKNEKKKSGRNELKEIGLLAQEVEQVIPEAVSFSELGKIKVIDYNMITPVLIKAIQEQEILIESLQKEIKTIKSNSATSKSSTDTKSDTEKTNNNTASLEQNTPNPFSQNTEIKYYIPESSDAASLYIYNMNGIQIKNFKIAEKGYGKVTINGSELQPGMYLYTLIVDGLEIDTRRMIFTR